jgi:hypothetical protein
MRNCTRMSESYYEYMGKCRRKLIYGIQLILLLVWKNAFSTYEPVKTSHRLHLNACFNKWPFRIPLEEGGCPPPPTRNL